MTQKYDVYIKLEGKRTKETFESIDAATKHVRTVTGLPVHFAGNFREKESKADIDIVPAGSSVWRIEVYERRNRSVCEAA